MNNLLKRFLTGFIVGNTAIALIYFSHYALAGLCILASVLGLWEYLNLMEIKNKFYLFSAILWVIGAWVCVFFNISFWHFGALLLPFIGLTQLRESNIAQSVPIMTRWIFGLLYCALPFLLLYKIVFKADGSYDWRIPFFILIINYMCDTMAYFSGKWLGKHPFSPTISPKKTWEGALGGMAFASIIGVLVHLYIKDTGLNWLWITAIIVIFNQPGDLIESMIKRSVNAKDSGTIMPGHGGMLDRIDSFLTIFPILYVYWSLTK